MKATNILFAFSLVLASSLASHAQVGIGTATPAASSILDLTSTTKGLLAPRMTQAERLLITSPANGLIVYQTDFNVGLWVYNTSTSSWTLSTAANTAATVTNVAAGTIGATTVQDALNELDTEKAPLASPTFTGTPAAPTATAGISTTQVATTEFVTTANATNANLSGPVTSVGNATAIADGALAIAKTSGLQAALDLKAPLASPTFTGTPAAPTATAGDNSTKLATTAYADAAAGAAVTGKQNTLTNSAGLAGALSDETGSGLAVFADSPTLVTPDLGTPTFLDGTNITGTAAGLTAGTVTTNADLTGAIVSYGNATTLGSSSFTSTNLLDALIDETGTGAAVFATSPVLVFPHVGATGTAGSSHIKTVGTIPTVTGTGLGSGGSIALQAGSTDMAGVITISAGNAAGTVGTVTLTFNSTYVTNFPVIILTLVDGTGAWQASAVARISTQSLTAPVITWNNMNADGANNARAVILTSGSTYSIAYMVIQK